MKLKTVLIALVIVAMTVVAVPASWANSFDFQGVHFTLDIVSGNLQLGISSTTGVTGDWVGVNGFAAFEVKDVGNVTFTNPTALTGWTVFNDSLSDNGCISGNTTGGCFVRNAGPLAFTSSGAFTLPTFIIHAATGTFDLTNNSLKVIFTTNGTTNVTCLNNQDQISGCVTGKTGSLLSHNIPGTVPEPASLLLLGAGLAGIGIWRRKAIKA